MANLQELATTEEWETLLEQSSDHPVLLFKHSTTCPISAKAWRAFNESLEDLSEKGVTPAFVKVIESRPVSNKITEELGVTHQSPQVILIKNKNSVWKTSHNDITKDTILEEISR